MSESLRSPATVQGAESPQPARSPPRTRRSARLGDSAWSILAPLIGVAVGLAVGAIPIWLAGADPLAAYAVMLEGAFGSPRAVAETILKTTPLLLMGLGLSVAFRARVWNIGGEGQYLMGALGGVVVGLWLQDRLPAILLIPLMLLAAVAGGALWAGLAAFLKLRFAMNEIISTLMLNYIAGFTVLYLARSPLKDPEGFLPQTAQLVGPARLPLVDGTRIHVGFLLALALIPLVGLLLWRTPLGFRIRAIGSSQSVATYAGMNVAAGVAFALMFSGAMAGLAGIVEVSALHTRLKDGITGGFGFTGVLVALLGRLHPVGIFFAALFFAALANGAQSMHSVYGLPIALAQVIQGVVVVFVLVADALVRRLRR